MKQLVGRFLLGLALMSVSGVGSQAAPSLVGKWTVPPGTGHVTIMTIGGDNTFVVDVDGDGKKDILGTAKISGNTVTFTETGGPRALKQGPGLYGWVVSGSQLRFTVKSDADSLRKLNLSGPWVRWTAQLRKQQEKQMSSPSSGGK